MDGAVAGERLMRSLNLNLWHRPHAKRCPGNPCTGRAAQSLANRRLPTAGGQSLKAEAQMGRQGTESHQLGRAVAALEGFPLAGQLLKDRLTEALVLLQQNLQTGAVAGLRASLRHRDADGFPGIRFTGGQPQEFHQLAMAEGLWGGRKLLGLVEGLGPVHGKGERMDQRYGSLA